MEQISDNVFIVSGATGNAAIVQVTGWRDLSYGEEFTWNVRNPATQHIKWGPADNYPNLMRKLQGANNMIPSLLSTLRDMIYGSGPTWQIATFENGKRKLEDYYDERLAEWEEFTDLPDFEIASINQLVDNGNIFARFEMDIPTNWPRLSVSDSFKTRIQRPDSLVRGIEKFIVNPYFGDMALFNNTDSNFVNTFDPKALQYDLVQIMHSKIALPGQPYYSYPTWWSSADWIELANLIPRFHTSGIKNGYNIKYLIKMPKDYFDTAPGGRKLTEKEQIDQWSNTESKMRRMLSGEDNVNKSMFIKYMRGDKGQMLDNIDIIPLKNEMSDDAYSKILEMANLSITNAMSVMATLAGANPGKGNDSGSQVRVMADYQSHYRTPIPRFTVSKAINKAIRLIDPVAYKFVYRTYPGVQITTLDKNKDGVQSAESKPKDTSE